MRAIILLICALLASQCAAQPADPDRIALAIEALSRLSKDQIHANPRLKTALDRVLEATQGTPQFVELVRQFEVQGQIAALVETAVRNPDSSYAADALRIALDGDGFTTIQERLQGADVTEAINLINALGNLAEKRTVALVEPIVRDSTRDLALRKRAVRSLVQTRDSASALLGLALDGRLPKDLKLAATTELHQARWDDIKSEAARVLPPPQTQGDQFLPPIHELIKRTGEVARGEAIFATAEVSCINCHQVNGKGIDFGPNLSEIGAKLGKDALYEAIIDPSAGISFDYEAWQVNLKNGDEAFGLITSETVEEITVKTQNGISTRYKKVDVESRQKMTMSIMPVGLQQMLSVSELVHLVEYLASLKHEPLAK